MVPRPFSDPMRIVINGSVPNAGMDPEYTKAVVDSINNGKPMDTFEGLRILERVFFPQGWDGCQIVEAQSMWHVYQFTGSWTKAFGITVEVIPARSYEECVSAEAQIACAQA